MFKCHIWCIKYIFRIITLVFQILFYLITTAELFTKGIKKGSEKVPEIYMICLSVLFTLYKIVHESWYTESKIRNNVYILPNRLLGDSECFPKVKCSKHKKPLADLLNYMYWMSHISAAITRLETRWIIS